MKVKDVMTAGAECISPDASIQEAAQKMRDLDIGPLPVCENDRIAGFVTDRDIVVRGVCEGCDNRSTTVKDVMTPGIVCCYDEDDVEEAGRKMQENQIRRLAVLNKDKRLVGIVSLGDLAVETRDEHLCSRTLEEISEQVYS
ncbi:MAG: CBS domain-containing protein [Thermoguttaceae bacterium]